MATEKLVFCDTNYLLDICDKHRERHEDAVALLRYASSNPTAVKLVASISSFKDAYYILTRLYRDESLARQSISQIMDGFIAPVDLLACYGRQAMNSGEPDFEDGLISASAEREGASVIISADEGALTGSEIPKMRAAAFLHAEGFDYDKIDW